MKNSNDDFLIACRQNDIGLVKHLIEENSVNINYTNANGETALIVAVNNNHIEIAELLLKAGANPSLPNKDYTLAFMTACYFDCIDIVKLLFKTGTKINIKDEDGDSPLILASDKGHKNIVEFLLNNGADVNYKSNQGYSALMLASFHNFDDIVKLLLGAQVNLDAINNVGDTALTMASFYGFDDIVKSLLKAGADITIIAKNGRSALNYADIKKYTNIAESIAQVQSIDILFKENNQPIPTLNLKSLNMCSARFGNILKNKQKIGILDNQLKQVIESNFAKSPFKSIYGSTEFLAKNITKLTFQAATAVADNIAQGSISHDEGAEIYKYLSRLSDSINNIITAYIQNNATIEVSDNFKDNLQAQKDINDIINIVSQVFVTGQESNLSEEGHSS